MDRRLRSEGGATTRRLWSGDLNVLYPVEGHRVIITLAFHGCPDKLSEFVNVTITVPMLRDAEPGALKPSTSP